MSILNPVLKPIAKLMPSGPPSQMLHSPTPAKDTPLLNWEAAQEADKLETAKIATAKLEADTKAEEKATLLAKRRKPSKRYYTEGGAAGLLGQAPVNLKSLLGE